jgi:hypothetical protein
MAQTETLFSPLGQCCGLEDDMKLNQADRDRQIHERAVKIQREQGSDVYRTEDYHALAKRLIEEEEQMGLPVDPYPLNQESTSASSAQKGSGSIHARRERH